MKLSIVVPCYNEEANLPRLLGRFRTALAGRSDVEVVLVNNGSTDGSAAVFQRELARSENRFARVVTVPVNQGYGYGILCGLRAADGEYLAWTHADLQTDPGDLLPGLERIEQAPLPERCLVRGRRRGRNWFDVVFTQGMGIVASLALRARLVDINAQPKLFHRSFLAEMDDAPWDFALDLYVLWLAQRLHFTILEQPVFFGKREHGDAKGGGTLRGKWRLTLRTWKYIMRLRREQRQTRSGPTVPPLIAADAYAKSK